MQYSRLLPNGKGDERHLNRGWHANAKGIGLRGAGLCVEGGSYLLGIRGETDAKTGEKYAALTAKTNSHRVQPRPLGSPEPGLGRRQASGDVPETGAEGVVRVA